MSKPSTLLPVSERSQERLKNPLNTSTLWRCYSIKSNMGLNHSSESEHRNATLSTKIAYITRQVNKACRAGGINEWKHGFRALWTVIRTYSL